jgi:hypothetical protein
LKKILFGFILVSILAGTKNVYGDVFDCLGEITEVGDYITVHVKSYENMLSTYLTFEKNIAPRIEMTTGLLYAGEFAKGQVIKIIYEEEPDDGLIMPKFLLFNPENPDAADIIVKLGKKTSANRFLSADDLYTIIISENAQVMDVNGTDTVLKEGEYILGWSRETLSEEWERVIVLSGAVLLHNANDSAINDTFASAHKYE